MQFYNYLLQMLYFTKKNHIYSVIYEQLYNLDNLC